MAHFKDRVDGKIVKLKLDAKASVHARVHNLGGRNLLGSTAVCRERRLASEIGQWRWREPREVAAVQQAAMHEHVDREGRSVGGQATDRYSSIPSHVDATRPPRCHFHVSVESKLERARLPRPSKSERAIVYSRRVGTVVGHADGRQLLQLWDELLER